MTDETLEAATKIIAEINGTFCNKDEGACDLEYCNCRVIARQIIELAQRQEREACAKVADDYAAPNRFSVADCWKDNQSPSEVYDTAAIDVGGWIAQEIRARALPSTDEEPR